MIDVLGLHGQAREMEEFERKPHNNSIPMKVEIMAAIIRKLSSLAVNGLTYSEELAYSGPSS